MDQIQILSSLWKLVSKDGKFSFGKFTFYVLIIFLTVCFYKWDSISNYMVETNELQVIEEYEIRRHEEKQRLFSKAITDNVDGLFIMIPNVDLVTFSIHEPEGAHMYTRLIYFRGDLPNNQRKEDFQSIMINVTRGDYVAHQKGIPYNFLGDKPRSGLMEMYVFSCPVYGSNVQYKGKLAFYWHDKPSPWDTELYYVSCIRSARAIGEHM